MLLDPDTLDLAPLAEDLLSSPQNGGAEVKLELPASQLELATSPRQTIAELAVDLAAGRRGLARLVVDRVLLACAGTHPFTSADGALNSGPYHQRMEREYGPIARRQLVCGLHIHVGLSDPQRVLAVYNSLRERLPDLAALAANAPLCGASESGLASLRPVLIGLLPRQGIPPLYRSWDELAADLTWGTRAGRVAGSSGWWWELRLHPRLGTIEVRAPDAQITAADAAAVVAVTAGLVLWLAARHDANDLPPPAPSWRIAENRWSAARHGVHGDMCDLTTGEATTTQDRLYSLLREIHPFASDAGGVNQFHHAYRLVERNGADCQLEVARSEGALGLAAWLSQRFLDGCGPPPDAPSDDDGSARSARAAGVERPGAELSAQTSRARDKPATTRAGDALEHESSRRQQLLEQTAGDTDP
jgi:carboxylate-amine ligase